MNLANWEGFIKQIVAEYQQETSLGRRQKILKDWRVKLEGEPTFLEPFQIDEIIREVRKRLDSDPSYPPQPDLAQDGTTPSGG